MLTAEGLGISIGGVSLLADVHAAFEPGRVTAIIGPNGAGKSTLLSCLAGLRVPDRGRILLDNRPLERFNARERARRIGYLPQDAPLHWNITVSALAALGRFPHGDTSSETGRTAVMRALCETGLLPLAERLTFTLSGGERARAMLARVATGEPDWILADEPLAALDISHRFAIMTMLKRMAARDVGIVIVAHDLSLVARFADSVVLLKTGTLLATGPAAEVMTPANLQMAFDTEFAYVNGTDGVPVLISSPDRALMGKG